MTALRPVSVITGKIHLQFVTWHTYRIHS